MLKTVRTNFDRRELRRDRRYRLPGITVTLLGQQYRSLDWSLGGFLLDHGPQVLVATRLRGQLRIGEAEETHFFTADVVRRSFRGGETAFCFTELSPLLLHALDRTLLRRFRGGRV